MTVMVLKTYLQKQSQQEGQRRQLSELSSTGFGRSPRKSRLHLIRLAEYLGGAHHFHVCVPVVLY